MQSGEGCRRHTPATVVRPDLVVVGSPCGNALAGLLQRLEPVLIQTLLAKDAVEALGIRILGRAARLNENMFDAVLLRPRHECPACEFRSVVGSDFLRVAPKHDCTVQQVRDVIPANSEPAVMSSHSWLKSSTTVRHLIRCDTAPGLLIASLTKSMLHVWFTASAATRGTRTPMRLVFLRFLIDKPSAV